MEANGENDELKLAISSFEESKKSSMKHQRLGPFKA